VWKTTKAAAPTRRAPLEDLPWLDPGAVEGAAVDLAFGEKGARGAQEESAQDLLVADAIAERQVVSHVLEVEERLAPADALGSQPAGELADREEACPAGRAQRRDSPGTFGEEPEEPATLKLEKAPGFVHSDAEKGRQKLLVSERGSVGGPQDPLLRRPERSRPLIPPSRPVPA
jgi:hypothetical protein